MKIQAVGMKDGFLTSLESRDDIVPINVRLITNVPEDVVDKWSEELLELVTTEYCFSGATPLENDDPFKLLWIVNSFFDEKPSITADFDITEYTDDYDPEAVY